MRIADRFIAVLSVALYLAAAFLPCESPFSPASGAGEASVSHANREFPLPDTDGRNAGHAHHTPAASAAADHPQHESAAPESSGHAHHAASPAAPATSEHAHPMASAAATPALDLVPTCPCGCQKTRAQVGGATARLGTVAPASVATLAPITRRIAPAVQEPASLPDFHPEIDPIPI